jgi:predicted nucleic acid-binding Zn ribbon protein
MPFCCRKRTTRGQLLKIMQRNRLDDSSACPDCGGERMVRLLSRIGVAKRGAGYYCTDDQRKRVIVGDAEPIAAGPKGKG